MRKLFLIINIFCVSVAATAQDPHFSQFFASPLTLNPALTGKFDGTLRASGNYRNQLPTFNNVYITSTVSVDFSILNKVLPETDTWGVGVIALTDKAGAGVLTNNYIGISTAYHKALNEDGYSQIGIGFQGMYGQKKLDWSRLIFEDQLTPFGFDLSVPSADISTINDPNISYLDINAGLIYTVSTTDKNNFYLGASMYHINRPKESFKGGNFNVSPRTTISAGGYFPVSDNLTLHTSGIYQVQGKTTETTLGGAIAASLNNDERNPTNVYGGLWMRVKDAVIPYIGLEFAGMRIGASYDINTSSLKSGSQSRGGMELSLIYIKKPADGKNLPCPKF
ncbi:MAG TPA: PorP/SprF family type IX secretion system membrane protein [Chitinophagaceae bacterium]|nr:PorP/SprF family type IX secretion system membrane protein [Chitinophagaceae bacterium]